MRILPVDIAVSLGLALAAQVEIWAPRLIVGTDTVDGSRPILSATALVMAGALSLRRAAPFAAASLVAAAAALQGLLTTPTQGLTGLVIFVIAAASVAATGRATAFVGLALLLAALVPQVRDAGDWLFAALLVGAAWTAAVLLRRRTSALNIAEADRDAAAERERARIARELHDIVAHRVTTMVVQAQAAHADPEAAPAVRDRLESIEEAGREALAELRDLLGVLRTVDDVSRAPQPTLADVPELVAGVRSAGVPIELSLVGEPYPVEPGIGLTAYRIVQEALTNVAKHAQAACAEVVLRYEPQELVIEITDDGAGVADVNGGNGLIGMRERVLVYGGTLDAGVRHEGGFAVRARLPVRPR